MAFYGQNYTFVFTARFYISNPSFESSVNIFGKYLQIPINLIKVETRKCKFDNLIKADENVEKKGLGICWQIDPSWDFMISSSKYTVHLLLAK